jgi:hypothetical protein
MGDTSPKQCGRSVRLMRFLVAASGVVSLIVLLLPVH